MYFNVKIVDPMVRGPEWVVYDFKEIILSDEFMRWLEKQLENNPGCHARISFVRKD